jgi:hypothetical protein
MTMSIHVEQFKGIRPLISANLLDSGDAQIAENCLFDTGAVRPLRGLKSVNTPTKAGTKKSIYLYESAYWLNWITDVDCTRGTVPDDGFARIYWTGDGIPKMSSYPLAVTGGTNYPTNSYTLGLPAPANSMVATVIGTATTDDTLLGETRSYVITFVTAVGEESVPSLPTVGQDWLPGQTVTLSELPVLTGTYNASIKRIYRRVTGSVDGEWLLVAEIANAVTTYTDSTITDDLSTVTLASATWDAPPEDLSGLISLPGGSLAGFRGNEWCSSVPYMPHAWPVGQRVTTDAPIVSHATFGSSVLITTEGRPYILTGMDAATMTVEKAEVGDACVSKRGTVDMGTYAVYPSSEGLIAVGSGIAKNATLDVFGVDAWKAMNPSSMQAWNYKGNYVCFYNNGTPCAFMFNPSTGICTTLTGITATAGYNDPITGNLYLQVGNNICQFDGDSSIYMTSTWRSKPFRALTPARYSCARIFASHYPLTANVYADDVLVHTQPVTSNAPFRLKTGTTRAAFWSIEAVGSATVNSVHMSPTLVGLAG